MKPQIESRLFKKLRYFFLSRVLCITIIQLSTTHCHSTPETSSRLHFGFGLTGHWANSGVLRFYFIVKMKGQRNFYWRIMSLLSSSLPAEFLKQNKTKKRLEQRVARKGNDVTETKRPNTCWWTKYTSSIFRILAKEPGWTQTEIMLWQETFLIINQTKVRVTWYQPIAISVNIG